MAFSLEQRQSLILSLPCFAMLSKKESTALAELMEEKTYQSGEVIAVEDAIVDSIFIIIDGQAEVTKQFTQKNKLTRQVKVMYAPVSILNAGDAIGLNDTGFFSTTGKRTGTVTAITTLQALWLDLKKLHQFLENHPHLQPEMYAAAEHMLKIRLIKQSLAFNQLSHDRLLWLAEKVEEVTFPKGATIFRQGDPGDRCYLIRSGEVEIVSTDEEKKEHQLAHLKTPTLFGEATLITRSPRNATARALTDTQLLVLRSDYLSELLESEHNVAEMFMTLMVDRSRPLQNPDITIHERKTADGQEIVILKNPATGSYFKLSKEGYYIWQQMDGKQTMQEITLGLADHFGVFEPDVVAGLISKLAYAGFVHQVEVGHNHSVDKTQAAWIRAMNRIRTILESRVAMGDADPFLTKMYNKFIYILFTPWGKILLGLLAVSGLIAFAASTGNVISTFQSLPNTWLLLLLLIPLTVFSVALHEFGHAFATKAFGHEVHYMGIGWYWLGPVAFTDTSDMWLSTRWPRIIVNIAGIYADILDAGIAALLILFIPNPYIQALLWLFALFTYINAFRMLSPLQELDGYYILMDLLDRPRLRQSSVLWLMRDFPKALRQPKLFKKNIPEVCYWLSCIGFLFLVSVLTILIQGFVFAILGIQSANIFVALILPFVVVLVSCLGIIAELRAS